MSMNSHNVAKASGAARAGTPVPAESSVAGAAHSGVRALAALRAFSLIEILVTVALLTVIILGLVAMFNQTRKAFTSSFTQVDVLESGRSAADLLAREIEQMAPYGSAIVTNFYVDAPQMYLGSINLLVQPLVEPTDVHVNLMEELFYLTRYNQQWTCVGYKVDTYAYGVGSLYRFTAPINSRYDAESNLNFFLSYFPTNYNSNNFSRIIDGVVDFRIHAFDSNGVPYGYITNSANYLIPWGISSNVNRIVTYTGPFTNVSYTATALPYTPNRNANFPSLSTTNDFLYSFTSNSVPAYVELELGVVEDRTLARYNALTNAGLGYGTPAWGYLTNHAGQVHLFRQRIPIRNVNPAAYQ